MSNTISVIIPCYNGAPFIAETLQSAASQTHPPLEILVIDDGSTDDSAAIAESFGDPARVIRQENQGESVARNRGIEEAAGEWVAFLDADDLWQPEKLERQLEVVTPEVVAVHTGFYAFGADDYVINPGREEPDERYSLRRIHIKGNPCQPSSLLVRKSIPARFPSWTQYAEDRIYTLELLKCGQLELIEEPLTGYRVHDGQQTARMSSFINRFETMVEWIRREGELVAPETAARLREAGLKKLAHVAELAYWNRDWEDFEAIREFLRKQEKTPEIRAVLAMRTYPAWIYNCKDWVDRLRNTTVRPEKVKQ